MPALGKLQLSNDDGTTLGFVTLTAIDGVAFTVEDGRIRDFRQIGLFPLHARLEGMLEAELAALPVDGNVDENAAPELVHVIRDVCGRLRAPRATALAILERARPSADTLRRRYLEPWLATGEPHFPAEGANLPDPSAFIHSRRHVTGAIARTRMERNGDAVWTVEYGADLARVGVHGHNRVAHAAMRDADAGAHPDCDGGGCGDWVLSGTNDAEWQRLGL